MDSGHTAKAAHLLPARPSSRLVLQPWVSDSWINLGVAAAPWWVPTVRKKWPSLAAMGGWEPSGRPRPSCSSSFHCHFSLKPFHSPSPEQGSVNTELSSVSRSATQGQAGQRVVPHLTPGWPAPFPHILRKPRPQGTLYCSLAGHIVLSFKSLIPVWLYIKLCQLHKGRASWFASTSPWHSARRVNAYVPASVLTASCVLIQACTDSGLPMPYMGGSVSF